MWSKLWIFLHRLYGRVGLLRGHSNDIDKAEQERDRFQTKYKRYKSELEDAQDELMDVKRELQHYKNTQGQLERAREKFQEECKDQLDTLQKIYRHIDDAVGDGTKPYKPKYWDVIL